MNEVGVTVDFSDSNVRVLVPCTSNVQNLKILLNKTMMLSRPLRSSPQRTQRVSSFALAERSAGAKTSTSEKTGKWFWPVGHSLDRQNNSTLRSLRALRETKFLFLLHLVAAMPRCAIRSFYPIRT
jgi:hypothetical protein